MMYVGLQTVLTGGLALAAQAGWPGLRVGGRLALELVCIRQMNRVNSRSD